MSNDDKKYVHTIYSWQLLIALIAGILAILAAFVQVCPPDTNFCLPRETFDYEISIKTAKQPDAATKAEVFRLQLKGKNGSSEILTLDNPKIGRSKGKTDIYRFATNKELGDIEQLIISSSDEKEGSDGWLLESASVVKKTTGSQDKKEWVFKCSKWLQTDDGGQTGISLFSNGAECKYTGSLK